MDTSGLVLGLRVALSLACVLGVLWFLARRLQGTGAVKRQRTAALSVVARQSLGGRTGVALVEIGDRRLLLGVSEHGVNLLTEVAVEPVTEPVAPVGVGARVELDPVALAAALPEELSEADLARLLASPDAEPAAEAPPADPADPAGPAPRRHPAARMPAVPRQRTLLEGSILDATTWRQAVVAVQERTLRR